ncbi:Hypothetical predicted protein [Pelobates cultripes]|uniref:Uncharacterized protein n=1 Tax=Pelobates cultripes TaxID=61616 RepID=A0AAD1WCK5_PELCU|nr:Hypothetical predicted protein [Pelobates cultripes]
MGNAWNAEAVATQSPVIPPTDQWISPSGRLPGGDKRNYSEASQSGKHSDPYTMADATRMAQPRPQISHNTMLDKIFKEFWAKLNQALQEAPLLMPGYNAPHKRTPSTQHPPAAGAPGRRHCHDQPPAGNQKKEPAEPPKLKRRGGQTGTPGRQLPAARAHAEPARRRAATRHRPKAQAAVAGRPRYSPLITGRLRQHGWRPEEDPVSCIPAANPVRIMMELCHCLWLTRQTSRTGTG